MARLPSCRPDEGLRIGSQGFADEKGRGFQTAIRRLTEELILVEMFVTQNALISTQKGFRTAPAPDGNAAYCTSAIVPWPPAILFTVRPN